MKIGILAHLNHPIRAPFKGGLERFTYNLVKELKSRGHDVVLFASGDSDPSLNVIPVVDKAYCNTYEETDNSEYVESLKLTSYIHTLLNLDKHRLDIVHNNSLSKVCLMETGIPTITTIHTPPFGEFKHCVYNTPHYLAFVSHSCHKEWRSYLKKQEICVIHNGVDLSEWEFNPRPKEGRAIWFGRIHPDKAPHHAIQAALNAGMKIDVVGPVSDRNYYEKWVEQWFCCSDVEYKGHLQGKELVQAVGNASVFINSPLWREPIGYTNLESMACGTPIATYSNGAASEIITPLTGVISSESTIDALKIATLDALKLNRQTCRAYAESKWSIDVMIEKYIQLYSHVNNTLLLQQSW